MVIIFNYISLIHGPPEILEKSFQKKALWRMPWFSRKSGKCRNMFLAAYIFYPYQYAWCFSLSVIVQEDEFVEYLHACKHDAILPFFGSHHLSAYGEVPWKVFHLSSSRKKIITWYGGPCWCESVYVTYRSGSNWVTYCEIRQEIIGDLHRRVYDFIRKLALLQTIS